MIRLALLPLMVFLSLTSFASGLEEDEIEIEIQESLNAIYNQGFCLFQYAMPSLEASHLYSRGGEYIDQFPFALYPIYTVDGVGKFYIDKSDTIKDRLKNNIPWESSHAKLMKLFIKPGSTAIDIGAHIGTHTITMSKCAGPDGYVVAFEPHRKIFRELCLNLSLNECTNVYPVRCAIGNKRGIVNIVHANSYNEGGAFAIYDQDGNSLLLPLDSFDFINISFIKIDVENMEGDVLEGAIHTIKRNRPVILIEIQGNGERANFLHEDTQKKTRYVIEKLQQLGYEVCSLNDFESPNDYLALPKE